jgi:hypothetical protein
MLRFLRTVSLIAVALGGLATFLFHAPKIVSDSIPYFVGMFSHTKKDSRDPNADKALLGKSGAAHVQPLDDRYVLPAGVTTQEFTQCLSKRALVDGRDFTIKEVSSVYRVLLPINSSSAMAAGYDDCRERLRR